MYTTFDQIFDRPSNPGGESPLRLRFDPDPDADLTIEAGVHGAGHAYQILSADRLLRHRGVRARWFIPHLLALSPPLSRLGPSPDPDPGTSTLRRTPTTDPVAARYAARTPEQVAEHALVATLDLVVADPDPALAARVHHVPGGATVRTFRTAGLIDPRSTVVAIGSNGRLARSIQDSIGPIGPVGPMVLHADRAVTGGSALAAAERLRRMGVGSLTLAVTHGIFIRGVERLSTAYDRIITFAIDDEPSSRPRRDDLARPGRTRTVTTLPYRLLFEQGPIVGPTR